MQDKLIIYLHANNMDQPSWVWIDEHHIVKASSYAQASESLATVAVDKEIIVLVPAQDVVLSQVTLPKMSRNKLLQAIPYALEEQLIADVESLHFALGDYIPNESLFVAIVSHQKMQAWLDGLRALNIVPDVFLPATLAVNNEPATWSLVILDLVLVRMGVAKGFACDIDLSMLNELLTIALANTETVPADLHIYNGTHESIQGALTLPQTLTVREENYPPEKIITNLAMQAAHSIPLNLLQGKYAIKKSKLPQFKKLLKMMGGLAAAWALLLFLYPTVSYFILSSRLQSIDEQMTQIYQRHFPLATTVVAPKLRMEEKLHAMTSAGAEGHFLTLLAFVGKALNVAPSVRLNKLDYQGNMFTLQLTATSSQDVGTFTNYLLQQGFNVKQQNATLTGSNVNATVTVEE